ncbi:hypothetical protein V8E51_000363 [Hyaloscypha variabilis]
MMQPMGLRLLLPLARVALGRSNNTWLCHVMIRPLSILARQTIREDDRRRIYLDNAENKAMLLAFYLHCAGSPVTLLVYHQRRLDEYEKVGRKIKVRH